MKSRRYLPALLVILALAGSSCTPGEESAVEQGGGAAGGFVAGAAPGPSEDWKNGVLEIVAFVGAQEIRREALFRAVELEGMRRVARSVAAAEALGRDEPPEAISEEQRKQLLDGLVERVLVQIVAASEGILVSEADVDSRVQSGIEALGATRTYEEFLAYYDYSEEGLRAELAGQELREKLIEALAEACEIAEEEIDAEFDRLTEEGKLIAPGTADFWHIVVFVSGTDAEDWKAAEEKIVEARNRIEAGEAFERVAVEVSDEQTIHTTNGLSQGIVKSQVPEPLQVAIFESELGKLSDPIGTEYGWHLVKPAGRQEAAPVPLEEAREPIRAQLELRCQSEAFRTRLDAARAERPVSLLYPRNAQ